MQIYGIGGWLAQLLGFRIAFFVLGGFALASVTLWVGYGRLLKPACAAVSRAPAAAPAP